MILQTPLYLSTFCSSLVKFSNEIDLYTVEAVKSNAMFVRSMPNMPADPIPICPIVSQTQIKFLSRCSHDSLNQLGSSFNNCASLNISSIKPCVFAGGVEYTLLFKYPHRNKSQGVRFEPILKTF